MKAHKVPATYYDGWESPAFAERFFVFSKDALHEDGIKLRYRRIKDKDVKPEHNFFIEENFYYIDWSIKGISYKVRDEISDFLNSSGFSIKCVDDLITVVNADEIPYIAIDSYEKFLSYQVHIDKWIISSASGSIIPSSDFKKALNDYVFDKVGVLIEENYFANYLENMWNELKSSIKNEVASLKSGQTINLSRKTDILEFFVVQYLRCDKRIKTDIEPALDAIKSIFSDMHADEPMISEMEDVGILSPEVYFYAILLDSARGNKERIISIVNSIDRDFYIDVLQAPAGFSYVTSSFPCVFSKVVNGSKEEMLFPVQNNFCLRFRRKHQRLDSGKYISQSPSELKCINNAIIAGIGDIVISEHENISFLF